MTDDRFDDDEGFEGSERVYLEIEEIELEDERGRMVPSVRARCPECGATTESFGEGKASLRRCMALMRDECSCGGNLFFTCEELED